MSALRNVGSLKMSAVYLSAQLTNSQDMHSASRKTCTQFTCRRNWRWSHDGRDCKIQPCHRRHVHICHVHSFRVRLFFLLPFLNKTGREYQDISESRRRNRCLIHTYIHQNTFEYVWKLTRWGRALGLQVLTMRVSTHPRERASIGVQLLTYVQVLTMRALAVQVMVAAIDIAGHEYC